MNSSKRIKILFVLNHFEFSNGVASVLRSMIKNLNSDVYEIHLLPLYRFDSRFLEPIKDKVQLHKGFGFYFRGLSKLTELLPLKWLYKILVRDKFDLEVAYQFGLPTKLLSISDNPRKICWMHGYDSKMELRAYYKKFHLIVSVAKVGRDKLIKEGFHNSEYAYNIIDEDVILAKSNETVDFQKQDKHIFITVCRLSPEKGLLRQLECLLKLRQFYDNFEFWIIGDGPEISILESYVKDNNMLSYVRLLGKQDNPFKYLKEADLFICSSFHEGFSTSCQEAAILGIPILSTNVDGAQEIVDLAECGIVVENSADGIYCGLNSILSNERILTEWKSKAKLTQRNFFKYKRLSKINLVLQQFNR